MADTPFVARKGLVSLGDITGSGHLQISTVDGLATATEALFLDSTDTVVSRSLGDSAFQDTGSMTVFNADTATTASHATEVNIGTLTSAGAKDILYTGGSNEVSQDASGEFTYDPDSNLLSVEDIATGKIVVTQTSNVHAIEVLNANARWKQYIDSFGNITLNASGSGNNTNVNYTLEKGHFQLNLKDTAKDFRIRDSSNVTYFTVTGGKKVGIGEAVGISPGQDVDIAGTVRIRDYGSGTKTGTLAYTLGVDSSGDIIEYTAAADTTIYSTNGTLSSNRTVTGGSNSLSFTNLSSFSVTNSKISLEAGDAIYLTSLPAATGSALDNTLYIDTVTGEVKYGASNTSTGTVDTSGTPVNNQVAVFTDADTIEGDSKFVYDSTTELVTVPKIKASTSIAVGGLTPSTTVGRIDAANDIVAYSTSDKRLKENVVPIENALEKVSQIRGVEFDWKELTEEEVETVHGNQGHDIGVIAQQIEQILPEAVQTRENGFKAVRYEKIVPLLVQAINELQEKLDGLTK